MKIDIETIEHKEQPYDTVGNYWEEDGVRYVRVSGMQSEKFEFLVALHELIEQALCKDRGITNEQIDDWDIKFEEGRKAGLHGESEPGDAVFCPYRKEHFFATNVERLMAAELGIDWEIYNEIVESL